MFYSLESARMAPWGGEKKWSVPNLTWVLAVWYSDVLPNQKTLINVKQQGNYLSGTNDKSVISSDFVTRGVRGRRSVS